MRRFCYKCGATEAKKGPLIEGLCQECFVAENPLLRVPGEVNLRVCGRCGAYLLAHEWREVDGDFEELLLQAAKEVVFSKLRVMKITRTGLGYVTPNEAEEMEVKAEPRFDSPNRISVEIFAGGKFRPQAKPLLQRARVKVKLKRTTCDICSRISSGYYEAILQVRGESGLPEKELIKVKHALERLVFSVRERDRSAFVAKVKQVHGGLDYFVSSLALARQMARLLKSKFGAKTQESAKLVGRGKGGRRKFRVSVLSRLPASRQALTDIYKKG